jgi:hypothetical protein
VGEHFGIGEPAVAYHCPQRGQAGRAPTIHKSRGYMVTRYPAAMKEAEARD